MISRIMVVLGRLSLSLCAASLAMSAESFSDLTETMRGFQESRVLLTAVELDVFTAVGHGATGADV